MVLLGAAPLAEIESNPALLAGSDETSLVETITNGRAGVMPAWVGRLDPVTIKALAVG